MARLEEPELMAMAGTDLARRCAVARCVSAWARLGWPCRVLLGLLLLLACRAPLAAQPPALALPTEAEATAALKKVQAVLVDELKLERNLGPNSRLANKLGQLNGEEFGTFLGSVAGGDADAAFQSIGRFGANYFVADLAEKWAALEFEGKELLQYVPADPQQTLAILQDLWWGKGQQAAENCRKMVREQAVKKLKQLSTDAVTQALDWVLSDTTGGSPGAIFVKAVEVELWFLEVSDRRLDRALANKLALAQADYDRLRNAGQTPTRAFDVIADHADQYVFQHALYEKKGDLPVLFEERYLVTPRGTEIRHALNRKREQARIQAAAAAQDELRREVQRVQQLARQAAKDLEGPNHALQQLLDANEALHEQLAIMDACVQQLADRTRQAASLERKIRAFETQLARLADDAGSAQNSGNDAATRLMSQGTTAEGWRSELRRIETALDKQLDELRGQGRQMQQRVKRICAAASSDPAGAKKQAAALRKTILALESKSRTRWDPLARQAPQLLAKIRDYQTATGDLQRWYKETSGTMTALRLLDEQLRGHEEFLDDTAQRFAAADGRFQQIAGRLKQALGLPAGKRLDIEIDAEATVYCFEGEPDDPGVRPLLEKRLNGLRQRLDDLTARRDQVEALRQRVRRWLTECGDVLDLDVGAESELIRQKNERFEKYLGALHALILAVLDCTGVSPTAQLALDLKEAERLLREAQQAGGTLIGQSAQVESAAQQLHSLHTALARIEAKTSGASAGLDALLVRCSTLRNMQDTTATAIQQATLAAGNQIEQLKSELEKVTSLVALTDGILERMGSVTSAEQCDNLTAAARRIAARAAEAARACRSIAVQVQSQYQSQLHRDHVDQWDQLQRDAGTRITQLRSALNECRVLLSMIRPERVRSLLDTARAAQRQVESLNAQVRVLVQRIHSLLKPYGSNRRAREILAPADQASGIAQRRCADSAAALSTMEGEAPTCLALHGTISAAKATLENALATLEACRAQPGGASINLLRSYADTAELFAGQASTRASAAEKAAQAICQHCQRQFPPEPTLADADTPPAEPATPPTPDRPSGDPDIANTTPPDISGLLEGVDNTAAKPPTAPPSTDNMDTAGAPNPAQPPPDLSGLLEGVGDEQPSSPPSNLPSGPPHSMPPPPSIPPESAEPLPPGGDMATAGGRYPLFMIQPQSGQQNRIPFDLVWQPDGAEATASLQVSASATAETRQELAQLGLPHGITLRAQRQQGTYICRGADLDRLMQAVLQAMAKLADAIGDTLIAAASGFTVEPDSGDHTRLRVHRAVAYLTPRDGAVHVRIIVEFTESTATKPAKRRKESVELIAKRQ